MTLAEIKDKKLDCIIHTPLKSQVEVLIQEMPSANNQGEAKRWVDYWDNCGSECCYRIVNGKIGGYCERGYYILHYRSTPIYEFSDLFADGGIVTPKPRDESMSFASAPYLDLSLILPTNSRELEEKFNEELAKHFNAFPNDGISAKNGGKNSMKFTFYFNVNEGTRVDKSCNDTVPTMTTNIELLGGNVFDKVIAIEGSATCDKADYDKRQGVLEALANAVFDGNFEKAYDKAVKANALCERQDRTCTYCGKVFDTVEERQAEEAWHVERRKARRERYLLRKRAKEIAFEEQAQKMAKEIIAEDNKK